MLKIKFIIICLFLIVFCLTSSPFSLVPSQVEAADQFLPRSAQDQLKKEFKDLPAPVTLIVFTQEMQCGTCKQNDQLVEEVSKTSPKLKVEKYDLQKNMLTAKDYAVDKIPVIIPVATKDYGIRFFGVPSGYEFSNLVEAIRDVSRGSTSLPKDIVARLQKIKKPVHIQVLVTPTCPYCTEMVRLAHQFAIHNKNIRADMVMVSEFPYLAERYSVVGVPTTVINETFTFTGPVSAEELLKNIEKLIR
jgi:glutaredoxin-like protein